MDKQLIAMALAGIWGELFLCVSERRWLDVLVYGLGVVIVFVSGMIAVSVWFPVFLGLLFLLSRRRIIDWGIFLGGLLILYFSLNNNHPLWGWFFIWEAGFFISSSQKTHILFLYSLVVTLLAYINQSFFINDSFFLWSSFAIGLAMWQFLSSADRLWYRYGFVNLLRVLMTVLSPVGNLGKAFAFLGIAILSFLFDSQTKKENKELEVKSAAVVVIYLLLSSLLTVAIFLSFKSRPILFLSGRGAIDWAIFLALLFWLLVFGEIVFSWLFNVRHKEYGLLLWVAGLSVFAFYLGISYLTYFSLLIFGILLLGLLSLKEVHYFYIQQSSLPEKFDIINGLYPWLLKLSLGYRVAFSLLKNWLVRILLYILLGMGLVYYVRNL